MITVGPGLVAIATAAVTWLVLPNSRHLPDIVRWFLVGAAGGLAFFGPLAAVLAAKARHPRWLFRHSIRINWYASMAMGLSLGYLLASRRHGTFDGLACASSAIVFLGAVVKIGLSDALQPRRYHVG